MTLETRKKISKSLKLAYINGKRHTIPPSQLGVKRSQETCNKIGLIKRGHIKTKETRIKMSLSMIGKNSKGGITPMNAKIRNSIEFRLWRESVFARDNWTCQKTGIKGGKLHPHHIQNFAQYPELRFAIDNGITLSKKSHEEFHKKYGRRNNTLEQLNEFLLNK